MALEPCRDLVRALPHPLVAFLQVWLGIAELLPAPQALAEQALDVEPLPVVGHHSLAAFLGLAQQPLGPRGLLFLGPHPAPRPRRRRPGLRGCWGGRGRAWPCGARVPPRTAGWPRRADRRPDRSRRGPTCSGASRGGRGRAWLSGV